MKIESFTQEQIDSFPKYVKKWTDIGLSTTGLNKEAVELAVKTLYKCGEIPEPKEITLCSSPIVALYAKAMLNIKGVKIKDTYPKDFSSLMKNITKDVADDMSSSFHDFIYGQHEAYWLSFYDVFINNGLPELYKQLEGLCMCAKECGWILAYDDTCFVSEKPVSLSLDDRGRLHNLTGPACKWSDGYAIYSINGIRLNDDNSFIVTDPSRINPDTILAESNAEVRRVMMNIYGQDNFIKNGKSILIHQDEWGKLWKKEVPDDEPVVMVEVLNSTPEPDGEFKTYFIRVKPDVTTAHEAVASTFKRTSENYRPIAQT